MNLKEIRMTGVDKKWIEMSKKIYRYVDQDIFNITCKNKVHYLPVRFNIMAFCFPIGLKNNTQHSLMIQEQYSEDLRSPAIIHFPGNKPWNLKGMAYSEDWWKYMRSNRLFNIYFHCNYLYFTLLNFVHLNFDRLIGQIGIILKSKFPKIYELLKPYFPDKK